MGSSAAHNGARAEFAAVPETSQALAPAAGLARSSGLEDRSIQDRSASDRGASGRALPEGGFIVESAKARALAAQRAYEMASLVAGLNPLSDPVP